MIFYFEHFSNILPLFPFVRVRFGVLEHEKLVFVFVRVRFELFEMQINMFGFVLFDSKIRTNSSEHEQFVFVGSSNL